MAIVGLIPEPSVVNAPVDIQVPVAAGTRIITETNSVKPCYVRPILSGHFNTAPTVPVTTACVIYTPPGTTGGAAPAPVLVDTDVVKFADGYNSAGTDPTAPAYLSNALRVVNVKNVNKALILCDTMATDFGKNYSLYSGGDPTRSFSRLALAVQANGYEATGKDPNSYGSGLLDETFESLSEYGVLIVLSTRNGINDPQRISDSCVVAIEQARRGGLGIIILSRAATINTARRILGRFSSLTYGRYYNIVNRTFAESKLLYGQSDMYTGLDDSLKPAFFEGAELLFQNSSLSYSDFQVRAEKVYNKFDFFVEDLTTGAVSSQEAIYNVYDKFPFSLVDGSDRPIDEFPVTTNDVRTVRFLPQDRYYAVNENPKNYSGDIYVNSTKVGTFTTQFVPGTQVGMGVQGVFSNELISAGNPYVEIQVLANLEKTPYTEEGIFTNGFEIKAPYWTNFDIRVEVVGPAPYGKTWNFNREIEALSEALNFPKQVMGLVDLFPALKDAREFSEMVKLLKEGGLFDSVSLDKSQAVMEIIEILKTTTGEYPLLEQL